MSETVTTDVGTSAAAPAAEATSTTTTNNNTTTTTNNNTSTRRGPSESDVYDRQIRLWGAEAQKKMQNSRVLYVHVTGGSAEVLKNLCLAGIKASLCDPRPASVLERDPCFFTPPRTKSKSKSSSSKNETVEQEQEQEQEEEQQQQQQQQQEEQQQEDEAPPHKKARPCSVAETVKPLVEELNPLLGECAVLDKEVSELTRDDLAGFAVVVASKIPLAEAVRLSQLAKAVDHNNNNDDDHNNDDDGCSCSCSCAFYTIDCFGMRGAATIDFGKRDFEYRPEVGKKLLDPTPIRDYVPLEEMVRVPLGLATNRFHKTRPPPTWIMYRALMDHNATTGTWLGDHPPDGTNNNNNSDNNNNNSDNNNNNSDNNNNNNNNNNNDSDRATVMKFLANEGVALTEHELDDLIQAGTAQVPPVCAVLGGMVGNEVIKVISGKGEPANNTLLLDGAACKAWTFLVKQQQQQAKKTTTVAA
eukprot:CAMPEP_0172410040 /NCGR_PEP_ID=MMETSP1061-20121228/76677_1 /TAXON_ID=37318 /ORGANISM="Pseudo-nitzschia pungens, Strain cf. pungens" /LENGTH=471 /DNA_ID=CAMNT_0013146209 /DNA_START=129 /DNA_END=1544 /DNA_ORIENTATION=-